MDMLLDYINYNYPNKVATAHGILTFAHVAKKQHLVQSDVSQSDSMKCLAICFLLSTHTAVI